MNGLCRLFGERIGERIGERVGERVGERIGDRIGLCRSGKPGNLLA